MISHVTNIGLSCKLFNMGRYSTPKQKLIKSRKYDKLNYLVSISENRYIRASDAIRETYEKRDEDIIKIDRMDKNKRDNDWRVDTLMVKLNKNGENVAYEHKVCLKRRKDVGPYGSKCWVFRNKSSF